MEDNFPTDGGEGETVLGCSKHTTFIVHFMSTIITSAPPHIIWHEIPEVGDPRLEDRIGGQMQIPEGWALMGAHGNSSSQEGISPNPDGFDFHPDF